MTDDELSKWASDCLKKTKYSTKEFAMKVKQQAEQERGDDLRVYECPHCNGWHLTSYFKELS